MKKQRPFLAAKILIFAWQKGGVTSEVVEVRDGEAREASERKAYGFFVNFSAGQ